MKKTGNRKIIYKNYEMELVRSKRKSIAIEINRDFQIKVRAPERMSQYQIMSFITAKEGWIQAHLDKMKQLKQQQNEENSLRSEALIKELTKEELRYAIKKHAGDPAASWEI